MHAPESSVRGRAPDRLRRHPSAFSGCYARYSSSLITVKGLNRLGSCIVGTLSALPPLTLVAAGSSFVHFGQGGRAGLRRYRRRAWPVPRGSARQRAAHYFTGVEAQAQSDATKRHGLRRSGFFQPCGGICSCNYASHRSDVRFPMFPAVLCAVLFVGSVGSPP